MPTASTAIKSSSGVSDRMSGNPAFVVMMQTTDFLNFDDRTFVGSLYLSALWCIFAERQMSAPAMVIGTE